MRLPPVTTSELVNVIPIDPIDFSLFMIPFAIVSISLSRSGEETDLCVAYLEHIFMMYFTTRYMFIRDITPIANFTIFHCSKKTKIMSVM